jgi:hypothetical protein
MLQEARYGNHLLLKSILQVVLCFDLLIDSVVSLVVTRRCTTASKVLHPGWPIFPLSQRPELKSIRFLRRIEGTEKCQLFPKHGQNLIRLGHS